MTTAYIADTGVFVRCGGPDNEKFQRLRRAVRQVGVSLVVPQRVYEELGGDPAAEAYPSGNIPYPMGFEEGWIILADELDYTDPLVSTVMDDARRWIANETDRDEDTVEKADTALIGLPAQLLAAGGADDIVLLTTDKPAENALREPVVLRKLIGTLRNDRGMFVHETLLSLLATWRQQGRNPYDELK